LWLPVRAVGCVCPFSAGVIAWHNGAFGTLRVWAGLGLSLLVSGLLHILRWKELEVDARRRLLVLRRTRLGRWGLWEHRRPFDAVGEVTVKPFTRFTAEATHWTPLNARLKIHTHDGRRWATLEFHRVAPAEAARQRLLAALRTSKAIRESGASWPKAPACARPRECVPPLPRPGQPGASAAVPRPIPARPRRP